MPAQRAGFTVTMFLIDVSPSMGKLRTVELPPGPNGKVGTREVTRLEWVLEFVMLKVQEMIFHGRKTEQCGVILFGTEGTDTRNIVNENNGGYEHVIELIPIGQPNAQTMTKIKSIKPSTVIGDPIDSVIVGIETQARYLAKKPTWTRKMIILTDGENPMEIEDWETTVKKMNDLEIQTSIIGVDFDDDYMPFYEENKHIIKRKNEEFYQRFSEELNECIMGTAAFALQECSKPDIKLTKSTLMDSKMRIGDVDTRPEEAIELHIKTSKCTAISHPPSMKKYAKRHRQADSVNAGGEDVYTFLEKKTQYIVERDDRADETHSNGEDSQDEGNGEETVEKEDLVRGYKYGASFVPVDADDDFQRLLPKLGIDICGFFPSKNFRRDWSMGEVQYVWADPKSAREQVAFSSIVQAMFDKQAMAIARWVGRSDPKMGVMMPRVLDNVDCFLWVQVPFADDLRKFTFRSLDRLVSKKGDLITKHAHLPTDEQMKAMETFVNAMDLMHAGDKDDDGNRLPWFDPVQTYNPGVHRLKQALFHGAITSDLSKNPLPPPHPELTKYFDPPPRVLKGAHDAITDCKSLFKVKEAPPRSVKRRKDGHVPGEEDEGDIIALTAPVASRETPVLPSTSLKVSLNESYNMEVDSDATEDESDGEPSILVKKPGSPPLSTNISVQNLDTPAKPQAQAQFKTVLPTPARSPPSASPPIDSSLVPGRIIGNISPLEDFKRNIKEGDVVSQAVHDLGKVIKEVITKPFSSRRHQEMLECLKEMRDVALQEDEISAWNVFLRDLKDACLNQTPSNQEFWAEIQKIGRPMSLISLKEARKVGGKSDVTEGTAVDFVEEDD